MARPSAGRRAATPAARPAKPAALRPGSHPGGGVRRTKPVKRASAGITPVRAGALLALLAAAGGLYGMVSSDVFATGSTIVSGNTWTSEEAVLAALAVPAGQNVLTVKTTELESRLTTLPAVQDATVTVALPDRILVEVAERDALVAWRVGDRQFLVDADGLLFGELTDDAEGDADRLPVVDDRRTASRTLGVGTTLDAVSLDAALRLGSLRPSDVGSSGKGLSIRVDDENGFVVRGRPADWSAIFGFYTPTLRPTDIIPGQVRLLRSLILGREDEVLRVILADERSGTYVPRTTPRASPSPAP
jgi:cell division septal protein FtsQ